MSICMLGFIFTYVGIGRLTDGDVLFSRKLDGDGDPAKDTFIAYGHIW